MYSDTYDEWGGDVSSSRLRLFRAMRPLFSVLAMILGSCSGATSDCPSGVACEVCDSGACVAIDAGAVDGGRGSDTGSVGGSDGGQSDVGLVSDGGGIGCGDTQSDPQNCGSCGYVCLSGTCNSGVCTPFLDECFSYGDYTTCSAACAASGRDCVQAGCDTTTFKVFGAQIYCSTEMDLLQFGTDECSAPISYPKAEALDFLRCCCR